MGRKDRGFDWVRDDVEGEARERVERRPRSRDKSEKAHLEALTEQLLGLSDTELGRVPLLPATAKAVRVLRASKPTPARRRQLLRVIGLLRHDDTDAIERALAGDAAHDRATRAAERWRSRILAGDDGDVEAFIEAHPHVLVQPLRQAVRQARREAEGQGAGKATRRLFELLREAAHEAP